ncbi:MAG: hypothetical protein JSS12_10220, partial [Verrucomicrobia bacterium]|nr:hypothetical protein [Verrucomicrobiota bacterium]
DIEAYKAQHKAFHLANPHIPIKPLVIIVLNQTSWNELKTALTLAAASRSEDSNRKPSEMEKHHTTEKHDEVKRNTTTIPKGNPKKEGHIKQPADYGDGKTLKKVIAEMERQADQTAAKRKEEIQEENVEISKKKKRLNADELKFQEKKFEKNNEQH